MHRGPPRSTPFPTRRSSDLELVAWGLVSSDSFAGLRALQSCPSSRSEEHTSELQSRRDLVCRLLLEKKKQVHGVTTAFDELMIPLCFRMSNQRDLVPEDTPS